MVGRKNNASSTREKYEIYHASTSPSLMGNATDGRSHWHENLSGNPTDKTVSTPPKPLSRTLMNLSHFSTETSTKNRPF